MSDPQTNSEPAVQKRRARIAAGKVRAEAHAKAGSGAGQSLARHGMTLLAAMTPGIISGFMPYRSEIDVLALLSALVGKGWDTCLPVVMGQGQPLVFRRWRHGDKLTGGVWNIPVPSTDAATLTPSVLLVPLLAFDRRGYRLGYGGGFYDRTLQTLRAAAPVMALGVGYAAQEVPEVPLDQFDQPLDAMLTENGPVPLDLET